MSNDLINEPSILDIKKIFGNKENAIEFLSYTKSPSVKELKSLKPEEVYQLIIEQWNYEESIGIVRYLANNKKYSKQNFLECCYLYEKTAEILKNEYESNKEWAFDINSYDSNLTHCIRKFNTLEEGFECHLTSVKKNYYVKSFNIYRSFLYEYFLIKYNVDMFPTLGNKSGVDFFHRGKKFDLKNASSVTDKFKKDFGESWKSIAENNPEIVAKYLYELQNEKRFGSEPRLLAVELGDRIPTIDEIENTCKNINFGDAYQIEFDYTINGTTEKYITEALVVFV